jgi:hypothetical protein
MKKALNIIGGIICAIICVILFVTQIAFMIITPAKELLTKDVIKEVISNIDVKEVISENPKDVSDLYGTFDSLGFSVEETNEILDSEAFKDFLNDYIYGNINNFLDNKNINFKFDDIEILMEKIEKEKGIVLENKDEFLNLVKEKYPNIQKNIDVSNKINPEVLKVAKFLSSKTLTIIFAVTFVVIYLIMCLLRWSIYKPLIWYGITTTLSSFIIFLMFLGISYITSFAYKKYQRIESIISPSIKVFKNKGMIISGIVLIIGIIMIIAFFLINKKVKRNDPDNLDTKLETL